MKIKKEDIKERMNRAATKTCDLWTSENISPIEGAMVAMHVIAQAFKDCGLCFCEYEEKINSLIKTNEYLFKKE